MILRILSQIQRKSTHKSILGGSMNSKNIGIESTPTNIMTEHPEKEIKQKKQLERDQIRTRRRYFEQLREKKELDDLIHDSLDDFDF
jgi:hypothetical protein